MARASLVGIPSRIQGGPSSLRDRRRERRRLAEHDRRVAEHAERYLLGALLADAGDLVSAGWVQRCWFTIRDDQGARRRIGPRNLHELDGQAVSEVCLVGAIVQAAGGIARAGTRPVHRAIDLTWATLNVQPEWSCASSSVRLAHIQDLIRWNDAPGRSAGEVAGLLLAASRRATQQPLEGDERFESTGQLGR